MNLCLTTEKIAGVKMNNFTKQELVTLWLSLSGDNYPELKAKLQSLIDNYCEHDTVGKVGNNSVVIIGDALKHLSKSKSVAIGYGAQVTAGCTTNE